jgi:hypothetical protein
MIFCWKWDVVKSFYSRLSSGCGDFQKLFVQQTVTRHWPRRNSHLKIILPFISKLALATLQHNFHEGSLHISCLVAYFGHHLFHSLIKLRHANKMAVSSLRKTLLYSLYVRCIRRSSLQKFVYVADMGSDSATNVPRTPNPFSNSRLIKCGEMPPDRDTWQALVKTIMNLPVT